MKRFFSWLLKPAVLALLGVILLSLVVWFEAPLLAFDGNAPLAGARARGWLIALLFLLWAGVLVWRRVAARLANARLMRAMAGEGGPSPAAQERSAELAALGQRMQEAMAILRRTRLGGAKGGLYQLPWYVFIGAPGSGKTTALVESGLKFPLAASLGKQAIGGVGGTRYCDWWFTDEAVLIDTAGRYTTQDSNAENDKAAWDGFLQLLRRHRRRRPVNGVIVTLSIADLLRESPDWRLAQAQAIRQRLQELREQLGVRAPIYLLVTKCDLLAGFMEFFDHLGREERDQVWGVSFALGEGGQTDAALAGFPAEFALLEQQLQARVLARMQQERDPHKRALIYGLPQQFAAVGEVLGGFLNDLFGSSRYAEPALLRGVYFSSGTQQGSPIDRVMGAMAEAFGLDRQALPAASGDAGRSYFITRLLRQVIFPEAELAGVNLGLERRRRLLQWGGSALLVLLLAVLGGGMLLSYQGNQRYVVAMDQRATQLAASVAALPADAGTLALLPLLDGLRALPGGYDAGEAGVPWRLRFGLYQGDKLGEGARRAYLRLLRETLLPRLQQRIEQQLRRGSANNNDYLYETLRVYLMLGDAGHFDADSVAAWLAYDDERNLAQASAAQRQALAGHAQALLADFRGGEAWPRLDAQLVAATRLALARMPLPQRLYNRMRRQMMRATLPEFTVLGAAGNDAAAVLTRRSGEPLSRGVNGMFSPAGHRAFQRDSVLAVADAEKERWVLARQEAELLAGADRSAAALLELYYADYIAQWDALLADVTVAPFAGLEQGARLTTILSGADSPLRKFMVAAAAATTLDGETGVSLAAVSDAVRGKLDAYKKKLEQAVGGDAEPVAVAKPVNPVDLHFAALHKLTSGSPAPLDQTLALLKDVALYLDAAAGAKRGGIAAPPGDALSKVKLEAEGKPAPLGAMLKAIDAGSAGLSSGSERERLNALWGAGPGPFCRQALAGRYPLQRGAAQDVTADDFGKFFAPGGLIDDFFQKNLLPYVDMGGARWQWRNTASNAALGIGQGVLDDFQRAAVIRDAYFGNGGRQASMRFELRALALDAGITRLTLELDGQALTVAPGALANAAFQLPSGKGSGAVQIEAQPASAHAALRSEGPWAWLRMLDKANVEPTAQGERYKVGFDFDGRKASFELRASSVVNPFRRAALEQFHCAERL